MGRLYQMKGMPQSLRSKLIRFASDHPEFRKDLLPLLKQAEKYPWDQCIKDQKANPKVDDPEAVCGKIKSTSKQAGEPGGLTTFAFHPTKEDHQLISDTKWELAKLSTQFLKKEAQRITDIDQAWRLSLAAVDRRLPDMAKIFQDRAYELDR